MVQNFSGQVYERGYKREDVLELSRFIDWVMVLPAGLTQRFETEIEQYEEAAKMKYVTRVERHALPRGIEQGVLQNTQQSIATALELRPKPVPEGLINFINKLANYA